MKRYRAKRNLSESGEPGGASARQQPGANVQHFVIQKHDASRLHYDFRLEMAGVLRSWAVPKGIPTKAGERVLAVEVEDHPLAYGGFEGVIPEGNYGAGTVMLWDRGTYSATDGSAEDGYRRGKLHVTLAGEKCAGDWTLVRMRARPDEKQPNWLLVRNSGTARRTARSGVARDKSVASGRTMAEIAGGRVTAAGSRVKKKPARRRAAVR